MYRYVTYVCKPQCARRDIFVPARSAVLLEVLGMALARARDHPVLGAPAALCNSDDVMVAFAPASCVAVPGSMPPQYSFDRHDCFWLAMSLSAYVSNAPGRSLDYVHYGSHTLTWQSMHEILGAALAALAAGFAVPAPFDIAVAVQAALIWSVVHYASLRRLTAADFELLPLMPPAAQPRWWLSIPFSS